MLATSGAMTSATAPVAAEIMAGRPPVNAMVTAMVNAENSPTRGSTPAMTENAMASGISASATTSPPRTSMPSSLGWRSVRSTDWRSSGVGAAVVRDGMSGVRSKIGCCT